MADDGSFQVTAVCMSEITHFIKGLFTRALTAIHHKKMSVPQKSGVTGVGIQLPVQINDKMQLYAAQPHI